MCVLFELLLVFIVIKLTNQVLDLWESVKIYFVGILKSGFTTNLYIKLISSWEVYFVILIVQICYP